MSFEKIKNHRKTATGYILQSFWTNAETVEFDDGVSLKTKYGTVDISSLGDGTITGAIDALNKLIGSKVVLYSSVQAMLADAANVTDGSLVIVNTSDKAYLYLRDSAYVDATTNGFKLVSAKGNYVELDSNGLIPSSLLPSYVDDVEEYANKADFPATGESGKIYIDTSTNITYRWGGTDYVGIGSDLALGETSSTAYAGDKGKANADAIAALQTDKANDADISVVGKTNDYEDLDNIPSINGHELKGALTSADLEISGSIDPEILDEYVRHDEIEDYTDAEIEEILGGLSLSSIQVTELPELPANGYTELGHIYQYIGATTADYTNGYFYKCINDAGTFKWENIKVQEGGGGGSIDPSDLEPYLKNENIIDYDSTEIEQIIQNIFIGKVWGIQVTELPALSSNGNTELGNIYQYIGPTNKNFIKGYFYKCINDNGTFKWENINVQDDGEGIPVVLDYTQLPPLGNDNDYYLVLKDNQTNPAGIYVFNSSNKKWELTVGGTNTSIDNINASKIQYSPTHSNGLISNNVQAALDEFHNEYISYISRDQIDEAFEIIYDNKSSGIKETNVQAVLDSILQGDNLPIATKEKTGLVKVGEGLEVDNDGNISLDMPFATTSTVGGIIVGNGLAIDANGKLIADATDASKVIYSIDPNSDAIITVKQALDEVIPKVVVATTDKVGMVKPDGSTITINSEGELVASAGVGYELPTATKGSIGGVKPGGNLSISEDGTLNVRYGGIISEITNGDEPGTIYVPTASPTTYGGVKYDNSTIILNEDGQLTAKAGIGYVLPPASQSTIGGAKGSQTISVDSEGSMSVRYTGNIKQYHSNSGDDSNNGALYVPSASTTESGTVIVDGTTIYINDEGKLTASAGVGYELPNATQNSVGGVQVGSGLDIDANGTISNKYTDASVITYGNSKYDSQFGKDEIKSVKKHLDLIISDLESIAHENDATKVIFTSEQGLSSNTVAAALDELKQITNSIPTQLSELLYDNAESKLKSTNGQDAINELVGKINNIIQSLEDASSVSYSNTKSGLNSTNVQNAIDELSLLSSSLNIAYSDALSSLTSSNVSDALTELDNKFNTFTGQVASNVAFDDSRTNIGSTEVQNALERIISNINTVESATSISEREKNNLTSETDGLFVKDTSINSWEQNTDYYEGDYVTNGNDIYKCKTQHTSSLVFDKSKFELIVKDTVIQYVKMPEATQELMGTIVQYTGYDTLDYSSGNFYVCGTRYDNIIYCNKSSSITFTNNKNYDLDVDLISSSTKESGNHTSWYIDRNEATTVINKGESYETHTKIILKSGEKITVSNAENSESRIEIHEANAIPEWKWINMSKGNKITFDNIYESYNIVRDREYYDDNTIFYRGGTSSSPIERDDSLYFPIGPTALIYSKEKIICDYINYDVRSYGGNLDYRKILFRSIDDPKTIPAESIKAGASGVTILAYFDGNAPYINSYTIPNEWKKVPAYYGIYMDTGLDMSINSLFFTTENGLSNIISSKSDNLISVKSDGLYAGFQYITLPSANKEMYGKVYQYIGESDSNYKTGLFYKCVSKEDDYEWQEITGGLEETITDEQMAQAIADGISKITGNI